MTRQEMMERLWPLQDEAYRKLQKKLIPGAATEKVIGVRTPALRALAKEAARQADTAEFLRALPHEYFDENQLHAFIISEEK
ncbi:MAG: DNA alkylation repair protein, partial [Clostridia bacterium]|nr:DNA alkylation repair protein [Clostridia bacterium]